MIKNIDYKFLRGKVTLISGPSGAGKSTLINIISGIISPSEGNILLLGYNLHSNYKKVKSYISCVGTNLLSFQICQLLIIYAFFHT